MYYLNDGVYGSLRYVQPEIGFLVPELLKVSFYFQINWQLMGHSLFQIATFVFRLLQLYFTSSMSLAYLSIAFIFFLNFILNSTRFLLIEKPSALTASVPKSKNKLCILQFIARAFKEAMRENTNQSYNRRTKRRSLMGMSGIRDNIYNFES